MNRSRTTESCVLGEFLRSRYAAERETSHYSLAQRRSLIAGWNGRVVDIIEMLDDVRLVLPVPFLYECGDVRDLLVVSFRVAFIEAFRVRSEPAFAIMETRVK